MTNQEAVVFDVTESGSDFRLVMSATLPNLDRADEVITQFLSDRSISVDLFEFRILIRESMLNAVLHGAEKDPEKSVSVDVRIQESYLELVVTDPGPGFDWRNKDFDYDELDTVGGRGCALMQEFAQSMEYNDAGNQLRLTKTYELIGGTEHPVESLDSQP